MVKRKNIISWAPLREIMKKAGAEIVSKEAISLLMNYLEMRAKIISEHSVIFAKHSKRKKIKESDVKMALSSISAEKVKSRLD